MSIIQEINEAWGWVDIDPVEVVGENDFGFLAILPTKSRISQMVLKYS
jgi:hypothetical protein